MSESLTMAVTVLGVLGSICSIAAYAEYRLDKFRQRKRRNKMMVDKKKDRVG